MKKKFVLITVVFAMLLFLFSCSSQKKIEYYSQRQNYISVTGIVDHIKYTENSTVLHIGFSEISPVLDDCSFKIVGENLKILQANKIDDKLKIGEEITFMTAPKYFGDGYVMPIVAISIDGEHLLEFEEGYQNLLNWLSE